MGWQFLILNEFPQLLQLIDLICLQFDSPVQFLITDYGVVFFPTPANQVGLSSRALRLNTRVFGEPTNSSPTLGGSKSYKKSLNNQSNMNKSPLNIGARWKIKARRGLRIKKI